MRSAYRLLTRWWTAFAGLAALAMLAAAHGFERFGALAPCALCLKQREVFWAALAVAVPATLWTLFSRATRGTPRVGAFMLFVVFATSAITAGFHAGGELGWWRLPASCMAGGPLADLDAMRALAAGTAAPPAMPSCGDVAWSWLGLSMAGWNVWISAVLAVFSVLAAKRPKDARAPHAPLTVATEPRPEAER